MRNTYLINYNKKIILETKNFIYTVYTQREKQVGIDKPLTTKKMNIIAYMWNTFYDKNIVINIYMK